MYVGLYFQAVIDTNSKNVLLGMVILHIISKSILNKTIRPSGNAKD